MRDNNQIHRSLSFLHAPFYLPSASWLTSRRQASQSSYLISVGREDRRDLCQAWKETSSISEWDESIFNRMLIDLQEIFVVFTGGRRLTREEGGNVTEKSDVRHDEEEEEGEEKKMENSHLLLCSFVRWFISRIEMKMDAGVECASARTSRTLTFFSFCLSVYRCVSSFLLIERVDGRGRAKNCFVASSLPSASLLVFLATRAEF